MRSVESTFDWFNTDGKYLDSTYAYIATLEVGETWAARAMARGLDANIDRVEVSTSTDAEPVVLGIWYVILSNMQFRASTNSVLLRHGDERPR